MTPHVPLEKRVIDLEFARWLNSQPYGLQKSYVAQLTTKQTHELFQLLLENTL